VVKLVELHFCMTCLFLSGSVNFNYHCLDCYVRSKYLTVEIMWMVTRREVLKMIHTQISACHMTLVYVQWILKCHELKSLISKKIYKFFFKFPMKNSTLEISKILQGMHRMKENCATIYKIRRNILIN
jgi:hypothetical protein